MTCCVRPESSNKGGANLGVGDTREAPGGPARLETWRGQRLRREPQVHHPLSVRAQRRPGSMVRARRPESPSRNAPAGSFSRTGQQSQEGQQRRDLPETEHRNVPLAQQAGEGRFPTPLEPGKEPCPRNCRTLEDVDDLNHLCLRLGRMDLQMSPSRLPEGRRRRARQCGRGTVSERLSEPYSSKETGHFRREASSQTAPVRKSE